MLKIGIKHIGIIAATNQRDLHENEVKRVTKISGRNASPKENPRVETAKALPLCLENHRLIETTHKWDSMPCPEKRKAKTATGSRIDSVSAPIKNEAELNSISMAITKMRALNLSANAPA